MRPDQLQRKAIIVEGGLAVASIRKGIDDELVGWAKAKALYLYVGRPMPRRGLRGSPLANPFRVGSYSREDSIDLYRHWLRLQPQLLEIVATLGLLCCWCYPLICHAEVIVAETERLRARRRTMELDTIDKQSAIVPA
jgi:hypothetical protein